MKLGTLHYECFYFKLLEINFNGKSCEKRLNYLFSCNQSISWDSNPTPVAAAEATRQQVWMLKKNYFCCQQKHFHTWQ